MNTIYKVVWNAATNSWVAAPEFAKSRGKKGKLRKSVAAVAVALVISAPFGAALASEACELADGRLGVLNDVGVCEAGTDAGIGSFAVQPRAGQMNPGPAGIAIDYGSVNSRANAVGNGDIAIGGLSHAEGTATGGLWSTAVGDVAEATAAGTTAIGSTATASAARASALGTNARATGLASSAIGANAAASGNGSIAIGGSQTATTAAAATGVHSIAIGENSKATAGDSIAIGSNANVSSAATSSIALGQSSVADRANTLSVGSATVKRQIVNVAAGTEATDAANFGQLRSTADSIATAIGGGSVVNADGTISAPSYTVGGTTVNSIGAAITNIDSQVTTNAGNISTISTNLNTLGNQVTNIDGRVTNIETDLESGIIGLVKQDALTNAITVAGDKAGTSVNFTGTDGARTLSGVAAGNLSSTSDEAVNGSQLFDTNTNVANNTTAISTLIGRVDTNEDDISTIKDQISDIGEGTIGLVKQDAMTNEISVASDKGGTSVNFTGTDGARTLSGVAAGNLSSTSDEAVNGAQLFDTNERVGAVEGEVATINTNVTNLGNQVTNIDGRVSTIETDLESGAIGLVKQDATTHEISVAAASGGTSVNFAGTDGARVLSGVANGVDDQDAATIAQLKASGLVDPNDGRALGALVYDDLSLDRATLGGTNGTVIANVGNGLIAPGSREAVNGGQLASIRDDLQKQIGDVSDRVDTIEESIADGTIGGPGGGDGGPIDDNGGKPISNVGDGVADSDAANIGQVNKKYEQAVKDANAYTDTRFDQLQSDVNHRFAAVDDRIDRMAALSGAYAGMAMNTAGLAGKNRVGAGVGAQGGKTALAVGYQRIVGKQNNASVSLGGAFSGSEKSVTAGAGFSW